MSAALMSRLSRAQLMALVVGVVALAGTALGGLGNGRQFFFSYLFAYLFWLGLSLGCFALTMMHQLTGGRWGHPTRRFFEAGFMTLPVMLVLLVPIFFGLPELYPWARAADLAAEKVLRDRYVYMNPTAFIVRQVVFFGVFIAMGYYLRHRSWEQDTTDDAAPTRKARTLSGPGIVIYGLAGTFASVDWIMSLEKQWFSTMFGVIVLIGQILTAFAFGVVMLAVFRKEPAIAQVVAPTHYHHLGNLLLAFVLFWTYVSFGQLLITYSGDLPPELSWYLHRIEGGWKYVVGAIALFHFFLPFFLLLFRTVKRNAVSLTVLAALLLAMHLVHSYWMVMPSYHVDGVAVSWMDFTAPVGVGGVWVSFFLWRLKAAPLVLQKDPGQQFAFVYGH